MILKSIIARLRGIILILGVDIYFNNGKYEVLFRNKHLKLKSMEFVKIVHWYYSKIIMLINFSRDNDGKLIDDILRLSDIIIESDIKQGDDIVFLLRKNKIVFDINFNEPVIYKLDFFAKGGLVRHLTTKIPLRIYWGAFVFSFILLLQESLKYIDDNEIKIMKQGLAWINTEYLRGANFKDAFEWQKYANSAFLQGMSFDSSEYILFRKCKKAKKELMDSFDREPLIEEISAEVCEDLRKIKKAIKTYSDIF